MIIKTESVDGYQIEIHENPAGHRRYWVKVNQQVLLQGRSLRVRSFSTAEAAHAAALRPPRPPRPPRRSREAESSSRIGPDKVPGYSNFGGGGPFTPMGAPAGTQSAGKVVQTAIPSRHKLPRRPREAESLPFNVGGVPIDAKLILVACDVIDDWWIIERAEHDGQEWEEYSADGTSAATRRSAWIVDGDIEGHASEMRAVALAIEQGGSARFKRCQVTWTPSGYLMGRPRGGSAPVLVTHDVARGLAEDIRNKVGHEFRLAEADESTRKGV